MTLQEWIDKLLKQLQDTSTLQWISVILAITEVLLARVNNIWLYPAGIGATLLTVGILYNAGLFAESLLNLYYFVMSAYGCWHWIRKRDKPDVRASYSNKREWIITILISIAGTVILYFLLLAVTTSNVPLWDAWISATAWAGMWLLAQRKIENWILLNISNAFAVPLLLYKELPLYALLTIFMFAIAVSGFIKWNKLIEAENKKKPF